MSTYKILQRHLSHRGRSFHFVSYEGHPANPAKQINAAPPTWFLIASGKRWEVMTEALVAERGLAEALRANAVEFGKAEDRAGGVRSA